MRTTLLVLSTLAILAACSQDGSTSPASATPSPNARASQDANPNGQGPGANVKPTTFSTITEVHSAEVSWDGLNVIYGSAVATCPAGSRVTGGGYIGGGFNVAVMYNAPFSPTSWRVYAVSHVASSITAYALCIQ